ncbi:glycosyltransferase family 2 protein [Flavobacterium sp. MAH-1]|uniref:Glycosyltransferase family 2 protein n=1 Tax=Flavobacterium agri TaxID=2743471 RepID=A0A7Y8Y4E1_9FLAO|nr:glycosyltransferase family 2 protein [Flavobacterium agri]NUY82303.1 glycosyltransferase family 2 protein [Flavobacterium agri]NYA72327.1 glycosyltransferase family 2 protein [Flavobacterium agri]
MKTAIVILNWNGKKLLEQFLPSVAEYSQGAEIWVADNASTDDSVAFVQSAYPDIKIVQNPTNMGFAGGYNQALKSIDADIYVLVNSDIEVTENWLSPILSVFEKEPETAIIQPKIRDFKRKEYFEYAGAAGGFIDSYGYPFCRGRLFDTLEKDEGQYDDDCEILWASGACFFIRKKLFDELGGFDADFFAHQEEIDLCWRAFNAGHTTKYVASSTVFHVGGATLSEGSPRKIHLNFRNSLLMLVKNLPSNTLFSTIFIRLCLDGIAGIRFLTQGKPAQCWAVASAHFAFYKMLRINYLKRQYLQKSNYFKLNNIVFAYFLERKKTFKQLF